MPKTKKTANQLPSQRFLMIAVIILLLTNLVTIALFSHAKRDKWRRLEREYQKTIRLMNDTTPTQPEAN